MTRNARFRALLKTPLLPGVGADETMTARLADHSDLA